MNTRKHDLEQLRQDYKSADGRTRKEIERTAQKIRKESGIVNSMRESLIKEHRAGRIGNVKDIHAFIHNKKKYGSKT